MGLPFPCWPVKAFLVAAPSTRNPWPNARFADKVLPGAMGPWSYTAGTGEPGSAGPDRHRDCYNARVFVIRSRISCLPRTPGIIAQQ